MLIAFGGPSISSVSSVGSTGVADAATSAGAGPAGGRAMPPVGSLGARIAAGSSKSVAARIGIGVGRGNLSATRTRARPNCEALNRSAASGRPARSSTAASGPRSADTGISLPIRADSVATVESASNGNAARHRLDEDQRQRVDVGVAVERLALGLLGRGVAGDVGGHPGGLVPVRFAEDAGQPEVDDAQPAVVTEHELRRRQLGVHESLAVGEVEATARLQADHQRLRRREVAAAVEEVAQVSARQVLDDHVDGAATTDLLLAPVVHGGEVGVRERAISSICLRKLRRNASDSDSSGRTSLIVTVRSSSVSWASAISVLAPAATVRTTW